MINISTPPEIVISNGLLQIFGDEPICYDLSTPQGITYLRFLVYELQDRGGTISFCDGHYPMRLGYRTGRFSLRGYANGRRQERYVCAVSKIGQLTYKQLLDRARSFH